MPLLINSVTCGESLQLLRQLADEGANLNQVDYRGRAPIHIACINGNYAAVKFLVQQGNVNLDLMDRDGKTALYFCIIKKQAKAARLLMRKGASVQVRP